MHSAVSVPARGVIAPSLPSLGSGSWQADTVTIAGGGVAVSQSGARVVGLGRGAVPARPRRIGTSRRLDRPAPRAVHLAAEPARRRPWSWTWRFQTPTGEVQPINYQGVVLGPGAVLVEDVGSEVQNAGQISTLVTARAGRIVASELQTYIGPTPGSASFPVSPRPVPLGHPPRPRDVGGDLGHRHLQPRGLCRGRDRASPAGVRAAGAAHEHGGARRDVVDRHGPPDPHPGRRDLLGRDRRDGRPGRRRRTHRRRALVRRRSQAGAATAVDGLTTTSPTGEWLVQPPGTSGNLAVSGAAPHTLALLNVGGASETFSAYAIASGGRHLVASGTLAAGAGDVVSGSALAAAGLDPIIVRAGGPMAVSEDVAPSGMVGVVTMPGLPLARRSASERYRRWRW